MTTQINNIDFTGQNIYVGFDVHLKSWKVTIMTENMIHKSFSQPPNPRTLSNYLNDHFPGGTYYSAYEAGFCGYWIHNELTKLGINSMVVNAPDIPTTHKERVQKEDKRDSRKLARSLRAKELTPIYVPSEKNLEDRGLVRTRKMLVKELTRYKNRIKSFLYFHGIEMPESFENPRSHWSNRFVMWLSQIELTQPGSKISLGTLIEEIIHLRATLLKITQQIRVLSRTDYYKENVKLLLSVPGVALVTAMTILTELETILRFKNMDQLCSYIGFVPSTHSSGEEDKTGDITSRGHHVLRSALIESAWIAVRIDPALIKVYNDCSRRMESNQAIIRVAKKLLSKIRFVLKNKQEYKCSIN